MWWVVVYTSQCTLGACWVGGGMHAHKDDGRRRQQKFFHSSLKIELSAPHLNPESWIDRIMEFTACKKSERLRTDTQCDFPVCSSIFRVIGVEISRVSKSQAGIDTSKNRMILILEWRRDCPNSHWKCG